MTGKDTKSSTAGQLGPRVTTERTVNTFNATATNIGGTTVNLQKALAELEAGEFLACMATSIPAMFMAAPAVIFHSTAMWLNQYHTCGLVHAAPHLGLGLLEAFVRCPLPHRSEKRP